MPRINKRRMAAGVTTLVLLFAVPALVAITPGGADNPKPPTPVAAKCASELHFFAGDVENNFFGPAADGDVQQLKNELHRRRCQDPALVVAHAHSWGVPGFGNELNSDEAFTAKIRELRDNPELWRNIVTELERVEAESVATVETMSGSYETLYMLDGVTDVPLIRKASPDKPSFEVLRFTRSNGQTVNLKEDCGFQPVGQFPNVPPVENTPPPDQPPASPPENPGTPETPPTTVPTGGKDHRESPVTDNLNDPCEACRPNVTEEPPRETPPPATTVQPAVPTPTTVQPPAPAPPTTQPPLPPGPGCVDPDGVGICEEVV